VSHSCPTRTYPFSSAEGLALAAKIKEAGGPVIDPTATSGNAEHEGVSLRYVILADTISVTVTDKPFVYPCSSIFDKLDSYFGTVIS
jgi:hypothetical protein